MFIQTEETPNPNTLKFIPGEEVMTKGTYSFTNKEDAKNSILAKMLFKINNVEGVFYGYDFITVSKNNDGNWEVLKPQILTTIMEHYVSGLPLFEENTTQKTNDEKAAENEGEDDDAIKEIKELIETRVRPAVAQDGGDIIFHKFEEGIVFLELHGACSGCPSSTITLKNGIENMLKHYIPEVIAVEAINQSEEI